ncbi:hypothetical protein WIS52_24100 [Pseudonocardia nematodicida]|uniref:Dihydrofolate reductase n=1 Tax=Pseudonocardia nematodicida TaxID=1206997 RepID=A0ABV1KIY5_9PSEU
MRLAIAPVLVGGGRRLFPAEGPPVGLRLLHHETTPAGVAMHVYEPAGTPQFGVYGAG